jgi:cbb3-type cytochrome oxidase subunit 3
MRISQILLLGIALFVLGVVAFAYQGINDTTRKKVIDPPAAPSNLVVR